MGNRERRAAKQQRRDQRRGHAPATSAAPPRAADRGLAPETLRALLRRAGADVASGDGYAIAELRRVLAEHLARRRPEVLAACDDVLAETGAAGRLEHEGRATEDVVTATVELLAARLT